MLSWQELTSYFACYCSLNNVSLTFQNSYMKLSCLCSNKTKDKTVIDCSDKDKMMFFENGYVDRDRYQTVT